MRIRSLLKVVLAATLLTFLPGSSLLAQQKTAAPSPTRPKIRTITAFLNLDRAQVQQQIADALQMLRRAKTIFESRGYEVQTIRIATQPFPEYTKGLTPQQTIAFFKDLDALAEKEKFAPGIGPAMLNADDPESQADLLADILAIFSPTPNTFAAASSSPERTASAGAPSALPHAPSRNSKTPPNTARAISISAPSQTFRRFRHSSLPRTSTVSAINSPSASNPPTS